MNTVKYGPGEAKVINAGRDGVEVDALETEQLPPWVSLGDLLPKKSLPGACAVCQERTPEEIFLGQFVCQACGPWPTSWESVSSFVDVVCAISAASGLDYDAARAGSPGSLKKVRDAVLEFQWEAGREAEKTGLRDAWAALLIRKLPYIKGGLRYEFRQGHYWLKPVELDYWKNVYGENWIMKGVE